MDENFKNQILNIIQKQPTCSTLNFDVQIDHFDYVDFTIQKLDIVCSDVKLDSFFKINNEIKEIIKEIESLNKVHFPRFIFKKCYIKFWNENINLDWHIELNECNININVQDQTIGEIYLLNQNFINCKFENLSLLSGKVNIVQIDLFNASIDLFQIVIVEISDDKANKIKIKNSNITKIMIQAITLKCNFAIHDTTINTIMVKDVDFEALAEFNVVTFQDEFDFNEITYKGLTLFDKCVFNTKAEFEYIIFEKFASFRGSIFNKGLDLDYTSGDKEINFFGINGLESKESKNKTSRETYRIIKNNFEKNGNKIEANKYHALELDQRRRELAKNKWKNKLDYIVFKLHDLSSEHSTNWFLALFWIFILSIFTNKFLGHELNVNNLFQYINILSSVKDFNDSYPAMVLNKVLLGYLYYQFLTAVRKDTRK